MFPAAGTGVAPRLHVYDAGSPTVATCTYVDTVPQLIAPPVTADQPAGAPSVGPAALMLAIMTSPGGVPAGTAIVSATSPVPFWPTASPRNAIAARAAAGA